MVSGMLGEYDKKRDFRRTPEPAPTAPAAGAGPLLFVVQKHAARRLHYDLRLELDGALKSWAIPGGPSLDPQVKRLAVMVEDHPLDYASFEGNIPAGEYGAGQVIVWDRGDYSPDEEGKLSFGDRDEASERLRRGLAAGKLSFTLRGHKLKGSWTLVKMKRGQNDWLLIKHRDEQADTAKNILDKDRSVVSGLTIDNLKAGKKASAPTSTAPGLDNVASARRTAFPARLAPMLASSAERPFSDPDWLFEPKLDGYRTIAAISDGRVRLLSRNGLDVTEKYAVIVESLRRQPAASLVLDGEIIALDEKGKLCFQCLQGYLESMGRRDNQGPAAAAIIYYVFDILYLDGYDLSGVPLTGRKEVLDRVLSTTPAMRFLEHFEGEGEVIYHAAIDQGLEGVLAKRKGSVYKPGQRSPDWLKIKSVKTDDFVIGGYTPGTGNRSHSFGALVLGYYNDKDRLIPAGNVGSGFDDRLLTDLKSRLDAIKTERSPFEAKVDLNTPVTWVRPELVAEVKFSERTRDGRLRAPVFLRLREDKTPDQVRVSLGDTKAPSGRTKEAGPADDPPPRRAKDAVEDVLVQLRRPEDNLTIEVEGNRINLTNLEKVLWPGGGKQPARTKRDLLLYLAGVAPYLLKHLRDRPLTLSRYPDGIDGEHFWQKHWGHPVPEFVATAPLSEHGRKTHDYLLCNNLATLLWLGQVADLELHTWFSRVIPGPDRDIPGDLTEPAEILDFLTSYPDFIIFDIDPYIYSGTESRGAEPGLNKKGFTATCEVALWLKEILDGLSLSAFVKTSGRTGLHIFVPILRHFDFHAVHAATRTICQFVLQRHPASVTTEWAVEKRTGKVFLDYNQNVRGKTLASILSPRPSPEATVSMPLPWEGLMKVYPTNFTVASVPAILADSGDPWAGILDAKRDLKALLDSGRKK
ncbi:MAG: DNA ligase D [Chloroflexi bacterium RBG_16_56_11]|nr:MAG: DNA ligase D [Chloroflexi bacterium RBG_16_56_11]